LSNASKRARTRSIGSRSRGLLFIFRSSPAVARYRVAPLRATTARRGMLLCGRTGWGFRDVPILLACHPSHCDRRLFVNDVQAADTTLTLARQRE
jgi:hypothetical protein